ncbi:hypothetical protein GQR91_00820 [Sphingomonas carotinifaciens]|uniref:Uncharacterized protein n=2 Tax=Sphingomonas carotinifaciens TaxID=1166323 RepID=A0A6N8LT25_9SPHN|nr:hypothetical protein [Sphingomonas carotinifaciens]MWC42202.1 hypothetical protein [Sphingomonas carotinifaciens]
MTRMAKFDDSFDPELGAACNRLAAFVEPLPEGVLIDASSQLTERDLALILRRLYDTRHAEQADSHPDEVATVRVGRASIPITASRTTR